MKSVLWWWRVFREKQVEEGEEEGGGLGLSGEVWLAEMLMVLGGSCSSCFSDHWIVPCFSGFNKDDDHDDYGDDFHLIGTEKKNNRGMGKLRMWLYFPWFSW